MSLTDLLKSAAQWEDYHDYKVTAGALSAAEEKDLFAFISGREYIPALGRILDEGVTEPPVKKKIGKSGTDKKRTVYAFPREENYIFKLLTYLLMRKYDGFFCGNLYSFRVNNGVLNAVKTILGEPSLKDRYAYKADISDYFNSVDTGILLPELKEILSDEPEIYALFERLLTDDRCVENGEIIKEKKGVMAGAPFSVFLANVYLSSLDFYMKERGFLYARYSDDIIVFAKEREGALEAERLIKEFIKEKNLRINKNKEEFTSPGEMWSFLGFSYHNGKVDVSPVAKSKLKAKIRRRARSIRRWQARKNAAPDKALRAFIRAVNRKLYDSAYRDTLNWSRWYFPVINTDESLKEIDSYIQQTARYVFTGKHTKSNYSLRYSYLKEQGYRPLVAAYYQYRKNGSGA